MASTKTKAVVALGALDVARQLAKAFAARQEARRDALGFGSGFRHDAAQLAHDVRDRLPDHLAWGMPPWRREPTARDRMLAWAPIAAVIAVSAAAVVVSARWVARREPEVTSESMLTDSRVVGAVRAGSQAIDAGVAKLAEGGKGMAAGGASAIAASSSAVKTAAVARAREELDERVVKPAKRKAILFGTFGIIGLTVYIVVIVALAQLLLGRI